MQNERLRKAMVTAHLGVQEISEATGVDPKTVQRWLNGRAPHARHRWTIAELVKEDERYLWPTIEGERTPGSPSTSEVVAAYGHRADVPPERWWSPDARSTCSPTRCCFCPKPTRACSTCCEARRRPAARSGSRSPIRTPGKLASGTWRKAWTAALSHGYGPRSATSGSWATAKASNCACTRPRCTCGGLELAGSSRASPATSSTSGPSRSPQRWWPHDAHRAL